MLDISMEILRMLSYLLVLVSLVHDGCALPPRNRWHFYDCINVVHIAMQSAVLCSCAVPRSLVISSTYVYRLALASG